MTSGEDLLLLALAPRTGRIREADRIKFALRASVLVDLALAHRITMNANRITVLDAASTGDTRLDNAMASLRAATAPSLRTWLKDTPAGYGMINKYLSILADQHVIRLEHRRERIPAPMHATLLDQARHDAARARVDRVAHGGESDDADRALAALARSCRLDRHLYRFSPLARARIARMGSSQRDVADGTEAAVASADAVLADAVARSIADGLAQLTTELVKLLRYEFRIEHITAGGHQDSLPGHHGGHGDSSPGHHHTQ